MSSQLVTVDYRYGALLWGYSLCAVIISYNQVALSPIVIAVPDAVAVAGAGLAAAWGGLPYDWLRKGGGPCVWSVGGAGQVLLPR